MKAYIKESLWALLAVFGGIMLVPFVTGSCGGTEAHAQEQRPPLKLSLLYAGDGSRDKNYRQLRAPLRQSEQIAYRKPAGITRELATRGVQPGTLSDAGSRTAKRDEIGEAMRARGLELLFVYWQSDQQIHVVVIGPTGRELRHYRPEAGVTFDDGEVRALLREAFDHSMPTVYDYREKAQKQSAREDKAAEQTEQTGEGGSVSGEGKAESYSKESDAMALRRQAIQNTREKHGNMHRHLQADLQPLVAVRSLGVDPDGFSHDTVAYGVRLDAASILAMVDSNTVGLAVTGEVDFAGFSSTFQFDDGTRSYSGNYFRGETTFRYMKGLSPSLVIFGEAGANFTSIGLASNSRYVGSNYLSALGGFGVWLRPTSKVDVEISGQVMPIIRGDTNDRLYGSPTPGIGATGQAKVSLRTLRPWRLSAFYDFSWMSLSYSSQSVTDMVHVVGLGAGYRFGWGGGS